MNNAFSFFPFQKNQLYHQWFKRSTESNDAQEKFKSPPFSLLRPHIFQFPSSRTEKVVYLAPKILESTLEILFQCTTRKLRKNNPLFTNNQITKIYIYIYTVLISKFNKITNQKIGKKFPKIKQQQSPIE